MLKIILIMFGLSYITANLNAQTNVPDPVSHEDSITPHKPAALYNGDIKELSTALEKKYAKRKPQSSIDSTVTFKAFVDKMPLNDLSDIELIDGERSAFSDFIRQGFFESGKVWRPMLQGGRAVKSFIRLHVQLNSDGSITITTGGEI
ncbi:MAG: hypothetical protein ABWZ25_20195 [Chitinophagaceae bacterium]